MASPGKKSFLLRIDPALWAEIERLAAAELRSANAQVEYLLREALRARLGDKSASPVGESRAGILRPSRGKDRGEDR
jgi:hypothetical protein